MKKTVAQPQDKYVLRMPDGLRDRIKAYAEQHGRSMNTEIVRILEREFPEPETIDGVVGELLDVVAVLGGGVTNNRIDQLVGQLRETIKGVLAGRIHGVAQQERERIQELWERYQKNQAEEASAENSDDKEGAHTATGEVQNREPIDLDDDDKPQGDR